ncbi:Putative disease resistance protein [Arachis hypogaea]|nr:Putative disease resistance protein [Arachis hypogaea]
MDSNSASALDDDPSEDFEITGLHDKLNLGHTPSSSPPFIARKKRRASTTLISISPENFRQVVIQFSNGRFPFISHCSLFPPSYEFSKQELVSLWVAQGLLQCSTRQQEHDAAQVFDSLVSSQVIVPSRSDPSVDFVHGKTRRLLYRINQDKITFSVLEYHMVLDANWDKVPKNVKHLSVDSKSVACASGFDVIERFENLNTLFLVPVPGFYVERIPRNLFLCLKGLRSLNFSRNLISELPSSIGSLKSLRYLDLSYTPIKRLPDSLVSLCNLQTLRLRGCLELVGLPKGIGKLISLRHLELDVVRQLKSMPPWMELRMSLSFEEAMEADLSSKKFLCRILLRWTEPRVADARKEEQILECLRPPLGLEELALLCYGGSKLPSWIADPCYDCMVDMTLHNCLNCEHLEPIGKLPCLQFLHIKEMCKLQRIDERFCRDGKGQQSHAFPTLKELTIEAMPKLEEWVGVQGGDFPCLQKLKVEHCPSLASLPLLSCLYSLKHLEMNDCPVISSLPDGGVSASLEFLFIRDCSELMKNCSKTEGKDWVKIAHVSNVFIDDEQLSFN